MLSIIADIAALQRGDTNVSIEKPEGSKLVFRSSARKDEKPISGFSDAKEAIDELMSDVAAKRHGEASLPIPAWRTHDLRRTFVTLSGEKKLALPHVIEAAVNHLTGVAKAGVAGVYNRAAYLDERRQLFNAWGEYVDGLVSPKAEAPRAYNVIPLRA